jgi:hypothetical protein
VGVEAGWKDFGDFGRLLSDSSFPEVVNGLLRRVGDLAVAADD